MPGFSLALHAIIYSLAVCVVGEAAVNVALHKRASYCNTMFLSSVIVDGNVHPTLAERIDKACFSNSFIKIGLGGVFYVHYVIVYEGTYNG